jgi:hypothetical protein
MVKDAMEFGSPSKDNNFSTRLVGHGMAPYQRALSSPCAQSGPTRLRHNNQQVLQIDWQRFSPKDRNHPDAARLSSRRRGFSQMFNPWFALSLKAMQMGMEAQSVIALRMLRLASGGARMEAEATRMVTEKVAAAAEAQAVAAVATISGHPQHVVATKALKVFKKRVRANKRRLTRR